MKISFFDRKNRLHGFLKDLLTKKTIPYNKEDLIEKYDFIELPFRNFEEFDSQMLFDYHIFPPNILVSLPQWTLENRKIKVDDIIVQQVYLPPTKYFSIKGIFGVRINRIINTTNQIGFSYETLAGHAETGISYFLFEKLEDKVIFSIHTYSKPSSNFLSFIGGYIIKRYQNYGTRKALENIKKLVPFNH